MKKNIFSPSKAGRAFLSKKVLPIFLVVGLLATSAFASDENKSHAATSLKKNFSTAENIKWKVTDNYTKASFSWNGQQMEVFYNEKGETIAISRIIGKETLPIKAQQTIQKKYAEYTIAEAIEYNSEENGVTYYVTVTKDNKKEVLNISFDGDVSVYRP
jgi:hypothetical protein